MIKLLESYHLGIIVGLVNNTIIWLLLLASMKSIRKEKDEVEKKKKNEKLVANIITTVFFVPIIHFGSINLYMLIVKQQNMIALCLLNTLVSILITTMTLVIIFLIKKVEEMVFKS